MINFSNFLSNHFPILQVILSLLGALICASQRNYKFGRLTAQLTSIFTFFLSLYGFDQIQKFGTITYQFGDWSSYYGIEYRLTSLNQFIIVLSNWILASLLTITYSLIHNTFLIISKENYKSLTLSILLFLHFAYLGIISSNDFFNIYVFVEIASLTTYILVSFGTSRNAYVSALNYLITGTIGATFILLAIGLIYTITGSLNFHYIKLNLIEHSNLPLIYMSYGFFITGCFLKLATFPLNNWLLKVYQSTPAIILSYIAPVNTIVIIYLIHKVSGEILFAPEIVKFCAVYLVKPFALISLGVCAILAVTSNNYRKVLIYLISSQTSIYILLLTQVELVQLKIISFIVLDSILKIIILLNIAYFESSKKLLTTYLPPTTKIGLIMGSLTLCVFLMIGLPPSPLFFIKFEILTLLYQQNFLEFSIMAFSLFLSFFSYYNIFEKLMTFARKNNYQFSQHIVVRNIYFIVCYVIFCIILR